MNAKLSKVFVFKNNFHKKAISTDLLHPSIRSVVIELKPIVCKNVIFLFHYSFNYCNFTKFSDIFLKLKFYLKKKLL